MFKVVKLKFYRSKKWASGLLISVVLMFCLSSCIIEDECEDREVKNLSDFQSLLPEYDDSILSYVSVPIGYYPIGSKVRLRGMGYSIGGNAIYIVNGDTVSRDSNGQLVDLKGKIEEVKFEFNPLVGNFQSRLIMWNCEAVVDFYTGFDRGEGSDCLCAWEEIQTDTVSYVVYDTTHIWIDSVRVVDAIFDPEKLKLYSIPTFSCSEPITSTGPFTWVLSQPIVVPDSAQLWNLIIHEKATNLADSFDCQSSKWRIQNKYSITPRETQNWQSGRHTVVNGKFEIWIR